MGRFVELVNFAPLQRGYDLPNSKLKDGKYPVVYSNGIRNYHNEFKAVSPGVITGRSGTIGKVTYIESGEYWPHNTSLWVTDFKENYPKFVYYTLQNINFNKYSSGSGVPTLNRNDIHHEIVYCPPIPEQQAIAEILQTWDTAIEKTEKLITEKEKQFGWLRSSIDRSPQNTVTHRLANFLSESRISDTERNPKKRITVRLHLKGVVVREYRGTESESATQYFVRKARQLIYGKQNIFRGAIGIVPNELDGYSSTQDIPAFDIADNIRPDWLFWYMSQPHFYKRLEHSAAGSGSKRLHPKDLLKMHITVPTFEEQTLVARKLDTASREIDMLNKLAEQYRVQKHGLMQKLLTGE